MSFERWVAAMFYSLVTWLVYKQLKRKKCYMYSLLQLCTFGKYTYCILKVSHFMDFWGISCESGGNLSHAMWEAIRNRPIIRAYPASRVNNRMRERTIFLGSILWWFARGRNCYNSFRALTYLWFILVHCSTFCNYMYQVYMIIYCN